jgi:hypothetical protein
LVVALPISVVPEGFMNYSLYESAAFILKSCHYGVRLYLVKSEEDNLRRHSVISSVCPFLGFICSQKEEEEERKFSLNINKGHM